MADFPGPYVPPDYSANSDDFLQYLGQMGAPQGLGAPLSNPPSDMSPSMSWMGAPQGYYPMGEEGYGFDTSHVNPGMGQPDMSGMAYDQQWSDPGYSSFGPEGQMQPMQQQGPTGHPILDKLMSPDMQDRAMAAAIFARGFVAPQEAINWAMQIRQQRQAQQARYEQSQMEMAAKQQIAREKMDSDKLVKETNRARLTMSQADNILKQAGVDPATYPGIAEANPDDVASMDSYKKWAMGESARVASEKKAKDEANKKIDQEVKVAGTVIKSGEVPSNFKNSEIVQGAARAHAESKAREQENDRIRHELDRARIDRINQLNKQGKSPTNSREWTGAMRLQQQAFQGRESALKQLAFLRQTTAYLASVDPNHPMKVEYEKQMSGLEESVQKWDVEYTRATNELNRLAGADVTPAEAGDTGDDTGEDQTEVTPPPQAAPAAPVAGAAKPGSISPEDLTILNQRWANTDDRGKALIRKWFAKQMPGVAIEQFLNVK